MVLSAAVPKELDATPQHKEQVDVETVSSTDTENTTEKRWILLSQGNERDG
jgi:hypothetical protein